MSGDHTGFASKSIQDVCSGTSVPVVSSDGVGVPLPAMSHRGVVDAVNPSSRNRCLGSSVQSPGGEEQTRQPRARLDHGADGDHGESDEQNHRERRQQVDGQGDLNRSGQAMIVAGVVCGNLVLGRDRIRPARNLRHGDYSFVHPTRSPDSRKRGTPRRTSPIRQAEGATPGAWPSL